MVNRLYDELAMERVIKGYFGVDVEARQVIAAKIPVSRTAEATMFLTSKKQVFVYINSGSKMLLSDVKKMVSRMGLRAEIFLQPKGRPQYFDEIGLQKFNEVFPGRKFASGDDISFYRTLAPYNPALVLISEVKDGFVYQYDLESAAEKWIPVAKFSYRRIVTC